MKRVRSLSTVALVSFLSLNAGSAMSKVIEQVPNVTPSAQTQPTIIAQFNLPGWIRDAGQVVNTVNQIRLQEQRRQEAERRRQELEAARREATEQQRLEAQRRQQYFESLSPEEKQTYLAEQKVKQAQRDQVANMVVLGIAAMMFGGGSGSSDSESTQQNTNPCDGYDVGGSSTNTGGMSLGNPCR